MRLLYICLCIWHFLSSRKHSTLLIIYISLQSIHSKVDGLREGRQEKEEEEEADESFMEA